MEEHPPPRRIKGLLSLLAKCTQDGREVEPLALVGKERDVGQWSPSTFLPRVI